MFTFRSSLYEHAEFTWYILMSPHIAFTNAYLDNDIDSMTRWSFGKF